MIGAGGGGADRFWFRPATHPQALKTKVTLPPPLHTHIHTNPSCPKLEKYIIQNDLKPTFSYSIVLGEMYFSSFFGEVHSLTFQCLPSRKSKIKWDYPMKINGKWYLNISSHTHTHAYIHVSCQTPITSHIYIQLFSALSVHSPYSMCTLGIWGWPSLHS